MSDISEWSTKEAENTHLDELTLSGEGGLYINKILCAVKAKSDEQDAKLAQVQGALVFRGTVADMTALEAVEDPDNGDTYSVTALGGENYAWNGTAWDGLGTSDANVVHKTGAEDIDGEKTFLSPINIERANPSINLIETDIESGIGLRGYQVITFNDKDKKALMSISAYVGGSGENGGEIRFGAMFQGTGSAFGEITVKGPSDNGDTGRLMPAGEQKWTLGQSNRLWQDIYCKTSTINTSDEKTKDNIKTIENDILDAWENIEFYQFQFKEAIEKKGGGARLHSGLVAQRIASGFEARGLDPFRWGVLCRDVGGDRDSVDQSDGGIPTAVQESAYDNWGVRYAEALCLEAACQRRRAGRLEARIAALEARLNGND